MATKQAPSGKKQSKASQKNEKSIVTVVTAPDKATYSMRRKVEELEDRVATCEAVMENNFGETLGQLITERTRAIERQQHRYDNNTLEAVFYVGVGLLLLIAVVVNSSRSSRYHYSVE